MSEELLTFLEQAGAGCISGNISDWPQLKPACAWAHKRIAELEKEISELDRDEVQRENIKLATKIAEWELRNRGCANTVDRLERELATEKRQHETAQKDFLKVMEEAGAKYETLRVELDLANKQLDWHRNWASREKRELP